MTRKATRRAALKKARKKARRLANAPSPPATTRTGDRHPFNAELVARNRHISRIATHELDADTKGVTVEKIDELLQALRNIPQLRSTRRAGPDA